MAPCTCEVRYNRTSLMHFSRFISFKEPKLWTRFIATGLPSAARTPRYTVANLPFPVHDEHKNTTILNEYEQIMFSLVWWTCYRVSIISTANIAMIPNI